MLKLRNQYDVFHFNFGTTLLDFPQYHLPLLDLPLYKEKGKIIVTYNGSDARQKIIDERVIKKYRLDDTKIKRINFEVDNDAYKRKKIQKFDRYADAIFALNPDLLYFLPDRAQFLPYSVSSWNEIREVPPKNIMDRIVFLHAPTSRALKGSDIIIDVFNRIRSEYGDRVVLELVENKSHSEALALFSRADVIIDQLLIGWYGGLSVEVMKMGKPVIAFIREEDLHFIPPAMAEDCKNAFIQADPLTLYDRVIEIIENPGLLQQYREKGIAYVNKWHDPEYIAGIAKKAYEL